MSLLPLPPAKMLAEFGDKLLRRDLKRLADSQQREHRKRSPGFDHLPVSHAETIGIHVFLAQFAFRSQASDSMTESAKEPRIVSWQVSAGAHLSRLSQDEQEHHEHTYGFSGNMNITGLDRKQQLERLEAWCATASAWQRFQVGLACGLVPALFTFWIQSHLPPSPCDLSDIDFQLGVCAIDAPLHRVPAAMPASERRI
jgi:hypothetical protein